MLIEPDEIGSHSICKGAVTYCSAGVHLGPPIVSVYSWAGWRIDRVKEWYLQYEYAGDELLGQTLAGIPPTSCAFCISPFCFIS